jgi:hypothetical protein
MKRTNWRRVFYVAASILLVMVGLGVGAGLWFVAAHRQSTSMPPSEADTAFAQIRARFSDQQSLLDMEQRQASAVVPATARPQPLRTFHTLIFDTRGGARLIRISVPYWFARQYARHHGEFRWLGELTFLDDTEFDPERIRLSLDQIEARGPGLVVDYRHKSGGQFIAWVD